MENRVISNLKEFNGLLLSCVACMNKHEDIINSLSINEEKELKDNEELSKLIEETESLLEHFQR